MGELNTQQLKIFNYGRKILKPKPSLSGSEWADLHFTLSPENSSVPGKWKTYPWQKDIIDAMTDYKTQYVVIKKPTRMGFTLMLTAVHAYFIDQRPAVQLHYQPNADEAKGYAEDHLETMIRDNDRIAALVETPNTRGRIKKEKTHKKLYPGGYIEVLGGESPRNQNRRTAKVVVIDEADALKKEAGTTGDSISNMIRRSSDFWDRKNIIGGKPVGSEYQEDLGIQTETSIIDYWFKRGTQEYRHLPCPHCGTMHNFRFEDLLWDKDQNEDGATIKHYPETAHFVCAYCDKKIFDQHKREMDKKGEWVAENPGAYPRIRSFHPWAEISYSPNVTWSDIVREFLESKNNRLKYKTFMNEVLARTFEDDFEKVEIDDFRERKEEYFAQVPNGVLVLSFGVDVQKLRLEVEIIGWGEYDEAWSIDFAIIHGDTSKPEVWARLDEYLSKTYTNESGEIMRVYCGGVDTGYRPKYGYEFCKPRFGKRYFAIKGHKAVDAKIAPTQASFQKKAKVPLFMIGVNQAKDVLVSNINNTGKGAGCMHFPDDKKYNEEYFLQLTAEKRGKDGRYVKHRARNEVIDRWTYSYSALFIAGIDLEVLSKRNTRLGVVSGKIQSIKKTKPKIPRSHLDEF